VIDLLLAERTWASALHNFEKLLQSAKPRWGSQMPVEMSAKRGLPDIVLFDVSNGKKAPPHPLMVVESKIDAAHTKHGGAAGKAP